jgi:hypothetical protein
VGTLPLAACQGSPLHSPPDQVGGEGPARDPDETLLLAAARAEAQMVSMLRPLLTTSPGAVRRTLRVHEAHLALLDQPGQPDQPEEDAPAGRRPRATAIAAAEERLARRHSRAAVHASSGQFARVLAGMAAAAAQQADVWRHGGAGA